MSAPSAARRAAAFQLALMLVGLLLVPLALRAVNRLRHAPRLDATYLSGIRGTARAQALRCADASTISSPCNPGYVVIGDSMAGIRIEPPLLGRADRPVDRAAAAMPAAGSAWWYLALKNWVIASGIHPRRTVHLLPRHQPDQRAVPDRRDRGRSIRRARSRGRAQRGRSARRGAGPLYRVRATVDRAYDAAAGARLDRAGRQRRGRRGSCSRTAARAQRSWTQPERALRPVASASDGRRRHAGDRGSRGRLRSLRRQVGAAADAARRPAGRTAARASSACSAGPTVAARRTSRPRCSATSRS